MTPQVVATSGTQGFRRPYAEVFSAALLAIQAQGFKTAAVEPDTGLITTAPKVMFRPRRVVHYPWTQPMCRLYVVRVHEIDDMTMVSAEPHWVREGEDIGEQIRWDIDNPAGGEHYYWRRFFNDMRTVLHLPGLPGPPAIGPPD